MGRAGAVRFAREGAAVAVVDIDADAVQAVVDEIEAAGGRAVGIPADLTRDADSRRIVREAANAFGGIDFVWNHVGHPGPASVEGIEMEDFDTAVTLNMRTVLVTTAAAIPEIRARGGGALLYTASTSGLRASSFSPVYSAVKHGVVGFVKALGKRLAKENIRVNAICPGPVDTPMLRVFVARPDQQSTHGLDREQLVARRGDTIPMGRPGTPGGGRQRGAVSALGRSLLHHRDDACGGRRGYRLRAVVGGSSVDPGAGDAGGDGVEQALEFGVRWCPDAVETGRRGTLDCVPLSNEHLPQHAGESPCRA